MKAKGIFIILTLVLFSIGFKSNAQEISAKASIDSTQILIGDQVHLLLEVDKPKDVDIAFPMIKDSLTKEVEVVERSPIDTFKLSNEDREKLIQSLTITSFDSGVHQIPPFYFQLKYGQLVDSIPTKSLLLKVQTMEIDTTKGPVDIKAPYGAPVTLKEVTPYILGAIILCAIIFFIFYYFRKKSKNEPLFSRPERPKDPPHIIALNKLDKIKEQKLWQQDKIKQYYSEVSETLREYIEGRFEIPAMEQTSGETIQVFKYRRDLLNEKSLDQLQQILSLADLVKFAKYNPLPDDNNMTLVNAYFFVNQTKVIEMKIPDAPEEDQEDDTDVKK